VFTYEPAFPNAHADFFLPFLFGIEEEAQARGYDLLLLTGRRRRRPAKDICGGRPTAHRRRLHRAGQDLRPGRTRAAVAGDYPFVAIGRREDAGGPCPSSVATTRLRPARWCGRHANWGIGGWPYLGSIGPAESPLDRWTGFTAVLGTTSNWSCNSRTTPADDGELVDALLASGATRGFLRSNWPMRCASSVRQEHAGWGCRPISQSWRWARHVRTEGSGTRFASFRHPREEMVAKPPRCSCGRVEGGMTQAVQQVLLPCEPIRGETSAPRRRAEPYELTHWNDTSMREMKTTSSWSVAAWGGVAAALGALEAGPHGW